MATLPMRHLAAPFAVALAPPAMASAQEDERARRVFDIFKATCLECHGDSREGNLVLPTHATLIKGGRLGIVVPHDPEKEPALPPRFACGP